MVSGNLKKDSDMAKYDGGVDDGNEPDSLLAADRPWDRDELSSKPSGLRSEKKTRREKKNRVRGLIIFLRRPMIVSAGGYMHRLALKIWQNKVYGDHSFDQKVIKDSYLGTA